MKWKAAAVASLLCGASLAQAPSNDLCANATPVFADFNPGAPNGAPGTTFSNVGATATPGAHPDVWFSYTATAAGTVTVSTCTPVGFLAGTADLRAIDVQTACGAAPVAGDEAVCGDGAAFAFSAVSGQTYLIRLYNVVGNGPFPNPGTFYVTIALDGPPPSASCAGAPVLPTVPFGVDFDALPPTGDTTPATCISASGSASWQQAWYSVASPTVATLSVRSNGASGPSSAPHAIAVFDVAGGCAAPTLVACGMTGYLQCALAAGVPYAVRVTYLPTSAAAGRRALVSARVDAPMPGDDCSTAPPLVVSVVGGYFIGQFDFLGATAAPGASADLCASGAAGIDFWRTVTVPFACTVTLTWPLLWSSPLDSTVAVFPAGCTSGPPLVCLSQTGSDSVSFSGAAGQTFLLRFARSAFQPDPVTSAVLLVCTPVPSNDECSSATPVPFGDFAGGIAGATPSGTALGSACGAATYPDVWYSFTAPAAGAYLLVAGAIDPGQSGAAPAGFAVFDACGGASLVCAASVSNATAPLTTVAGATYWVRIFAQIQYSASPQWSFSLQIAPQLPNDEPANAVELFEGVNPGPPSGLSGQFFTMPWATNTPVPSGTTCPLAGTGSAALGGADAWFRYTATSSGELAVNLCTPPGFAAASSNDVALRVYDGPPSGGAVVACGNDECGVLPRVSFAAVAGGTYYLSVERISPTPSAAPGGFYVQIGASAAQAVVGFGCPLGGLALTATTPFLGGGTSPTLTVSGGAGNAGFVFGSGDFDVAVDLSALQPGCVAHLDPGTLFAIGAFVFTGPYWWVGDQASFSFPGLPASLVGFSLRFQAVSVPGPPYVGPEALKLSGALRLTFGY
jgi:hypothetical protein